jgi:hypothetical protein
MTVPSRMNAEVRTQPACEWLATSGCTYNVFQHKTKPELFCAVPVDQPVPVFILWEQWAFIQSLHPSDPCRRKLPPADQQCLSILAEEPPDRAMWQGRAN